MTEYLCFLLLFFCGTFPISEGLTGGEGMIKKYPFMVSLRKLEGDEFLHVCGGSLLSKSWVLTAKQCVVDAGSSHLYTVNNFRIYAGSDIIESDSLDVDKNKLLQKRYVKKIAALSPLDKPYHNDAAMVKAEEPFELSDVIRPANVPWIRGAPTSNDDAADMYENCVMIGFGCELDQQDDNDEYDEYDDDDEDDDDIHHTGHETPEEHRTHFNFAEDSDGMLKAANVSLIPRMAYHRLSVRERLKEDLMAGRDKLLVAEIPESEVTACDGDFGGPMLCGEDNALYGVISRGDPEKFVVFTRVDVVSGWIAMLMQEDGDGEFETDKRGKKDNREGEPEETSSVPVNSRPNLLISVLFAVIMLSTTIV